MYPAAIALSSRVWETAALVFLVLPLTLLWAGSLGDTVLRKDLAMHQKISWFMVVFLFPVVGTILYVLRRPGWTARARSLRDERSLVESQQQAVETLDNLAATLELTRLALQQSTEMLNQMTALLSDAGSTAGFALPLTRIRPLGPVEVRIRKLSTQVRTLGLTLERMSAALGTNAGDLRMFARLFDWQARTTRADSQAAAAPDSVDERSPIVAPSLPPKAVRIPVRDSTVTDDRPEVSSEPDEERQSPKPGSAPGAAAKSAMQREGA